MLKCHCSYVVVDKTIEVKMILIFTVNPKE